LEEFEFKAEIQQLLNILVHSLYTDRDIFLRELISNATDALHRLQFEMLTTRDVLDPDAELVIRLQVDEEAKTITVSDTGIGMTRDEVVQNLGTIAQSGAAAFIKRMQGLDEKERPSIEMIGQFGVGFYSAFMVAQEIHVISRSHLPDAEACEWVSDGSANFRVGSAEKTDRGTEIIIHLTKDAEEFASEWRLEQIIKKHSDFVPFPVYIGERAINRQKPLWRQSPQETSDDEYDEFYKHLTLDFEAPMLHTHMIADVPVDIRSILYVPSRRDRGPLVQQTDHGLRLYAKGVMIQEHNKDMFPNHLRFVEGVIESEDLPLNVSRETVQNSPAARRIQKALVGKVIKELETLSETLPDEYQHFWKEFGPFIKEGVATDPTSKDDLVPLLRFHASHAAGEQQEELTSLRQYVEQKRDEQSAIYYLLGQDLESVARSPHLDYFQANNIRVLYLVDPIDSFLVMSLTEYDGLPLKNIDDASLELPQTAQADDDGKAIIPEDEFGQLIARITTVLGDKVTEVRESKLLRDSPCRLVSPQDTPGTGMQHVYRLLNQEYEIPPKIIEINRRHTLIAGLARAAAGSSPDPVLDLAIEQLYENQLLVDGLHPNPAAMVSRIQALMEAATASSPPTVDA
jgi:molecular chaperone HtpG